MAKPNMPLVLTAIFPGLGHLCYGAPVQGVLFILSGLATLGFGFLFAIQFFFRFISGGNWQISALSFMLAFLFGILLTIGAFIDAARLGRENQS